MISTQTRRQGPPPEMAEVRRDGHFNIGQAAKLTGLSAKMIRHYESIGLFRAAGRTISNYRYYSRANVHTLQFIHRARRMGFSLKQIETLVNLWQDGSRSSREVKALAHQHVQDLELRIQEMQAMRDTLAHLAQQCRGDDRPSCPILEDLAASFTP